MRRKKILVVFGTRPEVIKLAPVLWALEKISKFDVTSCVTAQHRGLLDQMLEVFALKPRYDLDVMRKNQSPDEVMERVLRLLRPVMRKEKPDLVLVQGDTTTAAAASLAAFYHRVPVAHVEAGLRSFDPSNPYPEEVNRILVDRLASLWFAPTQDAKENLRREGIRGPAVFVTGNTVVDALRWALRTPGGFENPLLRRLPPDARVILVTLHRRESFGKPLRRILKALLEISRRHPEAVLVYPVHPNPRVRDEARRMLGRSSIHLCAPLPYLDFLRLMDRSYLLLTDSGGLQEEGPSLHKPVLVLRETTERPEILRAGAGKLLGTQTSEIIAGTERLLANRGLYLKMTRCPNPYGDGKASKRIASAIGYWMGLNKRPSEWAVPRGLAARISPERRQCFESR